MPTILRCALEVILSTTNGLDFPLCEVLYVLGVKQNVIVISLLAQGGFVDSFEDTMHTV